MNRNKTVWLIDKRRERINSALKFLKTLGRTEYKKAVAVISFNLGVRREKAIEYLNILRDCGSIKIEDGYVEAV